MHFINCHGASQSSQFFGQPASGRQVYPVALDSAYVNGKIREGTIAAAECCYGGQLYRLSAVQRQTSICNSYLKNRSYGFFASTTVAYGPWKGTGQSDLICQYFLQGVLAGASLGRAALEARQRFVQTASPADPSDIKTLAQYNLYGDPSITPVAASFAPLPASGASIHLRISADRVERQDRRRFLFKQGIALSTSEPILRRIRRRPPKTVLSALRAAARDFGFEPGDTISFAVRHRTKPISTPRALVSNDQLPTAYHVLFVRKALTVTREAGRPQVQQLVLFIGKEAGSRLASITRVHSR